MKAEAIGFAVYCGSCVTRPDATNSARAALTVARAAGYRDVRNAKGEIMTLCPDCLGNFCQHCKAVTTRRRGMSGWNGPSTCSDCGRT